MSAKNIRFSQIFLRLFEGMVQPLKPSVAKIRALTIAAALLFLLATSGSVARFFARHEPSAWANSAPVAASLPKSREVKVGMYIVQLRELDLRKNQFIVDMYLWFQWRGNDIHPQKTFEIMNGIILQRDYPNEVAYGESNEYKKASCKVSVQITKYWDVSKYPRDSHELTVDIEENLSELDLFNYVSDSENSVFDADIRVPGWKITPLALRVSERTIAPTLVRASSPTDS